MPSTTPDRPYFEAWLKRVGRQLSASGQLSQIAMLLSRENGGTEHEWRRQLQRMLHGDYTPTIEVITTIDRMLAKPKTSGQSPDSDQSMLF